MKKLLSVLVSISLTNIILLGAAQGSNGIKNGAERLANMKIKLSKAEEAVSIGKGQLLKSEEMLNEIKEKPQSLKDMNLVKKAELMVNQLRLGVMESEQMLSDMRANVFEMEEILQVDNLLGRSAEILNELMSDYYPNTLDESDIQDKE